MRSSTIFVAPAESPIRRMIESLTASFLSPQAPTSGAVRPVLDSPFPAANRASNGHGSLTSDGYNGEYTVTNGFSPPPAVIVIDAIKSVETAIVELKAMRLRYKDECKYLVIGNIIGRDEFILLLRAGMDGYIRLQDINAQAFHRTVDAVLDGECAIPRSMIGTLASFIRSSQPKLASNGVAPLRDDDGSESELTTREKDVLRLLTMGARNREIAQVLVISLATVNKHVQHIFNKLEVHSRTAAMRKVMAQSIEMELSSSLDNDKTWVARTMKEAGMESLPQVTTTNRLSRTR